MAMRQLEKLLLLITLMGLGFCPSLMEGKKENSNDFIGDVNVKQLRKMAWKYNVTSLLVFGDSSVDPGNNNFLPTTMKSNFPPYGKDFFNARPTGRFCDGRLATDFIAEALGFGETVPAFLDRTLKPIELLHGVSFASASSGYDDLTANYSNVLSLPKQLEYLMHYKLHLKRQVGGEKAEKIIRNAIVVISMGTNDFLENYFLEPLRPKQFTLDQYQNFLVSSMYRNVQVMHRLGVRRLVVVGVPPLGCMPVVRTITNQNTTCSKVFNQAAYAFNAKMKLKLAGIKASLGMLTSFVDAYAIVQAAVQNPTAYGLRETARGCCGTGLVEYGETCKGSPTCTDPQNYVFWDAVHPSQKMYKILAAQAIQSVQHDILSG
ncbi:GDSL esterase/lipase [Cucumis melo var. makuwa]|uniref:GDSL esterase/lipase n=1 Tax=Cucumis melo var. makuwa TaxID=1194695 RepID=A0A5D3CMY5_CUCMM|nr:GDSL esterase/lipase [Cucumis melo var. makuwa]TYK13181.1 GDSL esterase/lipase [Cucumis melo var. makuwa]